jgi:hypothetical protein
VQECHTVRAGAASIGCETHFARPVPCTDVTVSSGKPLFSRQDCYPCRSSGTGSDSSCCARHVRSINLVNRNRSHSFDCVRSGPVTRAPGRSAHPYSGRFLTIDGVRLHYKDSGGTGLPVVLIHGKTMHRLGGPVSSPITLKISGAFSAARAGRFR